MQNLPSHDNKLSYDDNLEFVFHSEQSESENFSSTLKSMEIAFKAHGSIDKKSSQSPTKKVA